LVECADQRVHVGVAGVVVGVAALERFGALLVKCRKKHLWSTATAKPLDDLVEWLDVLKNQPNRAQAMWRNYEQETQEEHEASV
jgi:hypothetical protein